MLTKSMTTTTTSSSFLHPQWTAAVPVSRRGGAGATPTPTPPTRLAAAAAAPAAADDSLAAPFAAVVRKRFSNGHYSEHHPVPEAVLTEILRLTQRAPSSFNVQPYQLVVLRDPAVREKVAKQAMLGANGAKVQAAPVTVVFAADVESGRTMPRVVALLRKAGSFPEAFLTKVPFFATLFSTGHRFAPLRWLAYWGKRLAMTFLGLFQPVPRFERPETWAAKNAMLAAMTLMLAASAHGLSTCPMEGFDAARLRRLLRIPRRYVIPVVVSLGYEATPAEEAAQEGHGVSSRHPPASLRFPLAEVAHEDRFGRPWRGE